MVDINTSWFKEKMAAQQTSQRKVAIEMGIDPAAMSLMLRGMRRIQLPEAASMASILSVPLDEVLENAGIDPQVGAVDSAIVTGSVAEGGEVTLGRAEGPRKVPVPIGAAAGTSALRLHGGYVDGWIAYYLPSTAGVSQEALGRLAVVKLEGKGGTWLRVLKRGYKRGEYGLVDLFGGGKPMESARVAWAAPVLWIKAV